MRGAILVLFGVIAFAQPDVRKVSWGMTPEQVRTAESSTATEGHAADGFLTLRYANTEFLQPGTLTYIFTGGKLARAVYLFGVEHDDLNLFISDFHVVASPLAGSLSKAVCEHVIWHDDSLQEERMGYLRQDRRLPSDLMPSDPRIGLALSLGHFELYAAWSSPRTQVLHTMTGVDGRIVHRIEFRPAVVGAELERPCTE